MSKKPLTKDERCCERVPERDSRWPSFFQCQRRGIITRDGKLYCAQHDPVAKQKRNDASYKRWKEKWDAELAANVRAEACVNACANLNPAAIPALVEAARKVLSAAHLRTHGFPEGDISDLDFSKMAPAIMELATILASVTGDGKGGAA